MCHKKQTITFLISLHPVAAPLINRIIIKKPYLFIFMHRCPGSDIVIFTFLLWVPTLTRPTSDSRRLTTKRRRTGFCKSNGCRSEMQENMNVRYAFQFQTLSTGWLCLFLLQLGRGDGEEWNSQ